MHDQDDPPVKIDRSEQPANELAALHAGEHLFRAQPWIGEIERPARPSADRYLSTTMGALAVVADLTPGDAEQPAPEGFAQRRRAVRSAAVRARPIAARGVVGTRVAGAAPWIEAVERVVRSDHDVLQDVVDIALCHPEPAERLPEERQAHSVHGLEAGPLWKRHVLKRLLHA
ncbi:hypothetical protein [Sorangium sp. So ce1335]|uniref:hypothetical protein n=1 Tax=Sorangium sp. So ce1335 TaxID=3133335 RepID=UPI003F604E94